METRRPASAEAGADVLIELVRQNLKTRRLQVAADYLELLMLAAPTSAPAMVLRAELAARQGRHDEATAYQELASCLQ